MAKLAGKYFLLCRHNVDDCVKKIHRQHRVCGMTGYNVYKILNFGFDDLAAIAVNGACDDSHDCVTKTRRFSSLWLEVFGAAYFSSMLR